MSLVSLLPLVSFIIVARNASKNLPDLLSDLLAQDYPVERMEIILVDGLSIDGTRAIMEQFAVAHQDRLVRVLDNKKYTLSAGWNVALAQANGDVIIRVDAHSRIPSDFIRKNVQRILSGESIVGGQRVTIVPTELKAGLLALTEISRFGSGIAAFRNQGSPRYVDTLAHAAYLRSVFKTVGGFDERLERNQDVEIHCRMKNAGYRLFFDPQIQSFHKPRASLQSLLKQKYSTGFWIGPVLAIRPRSFSPRHFIPASFVASILVTIILAVFGIWLPLMAIGAAYITGAILFSAEATRFAPSKKVRLFCWLLPVIFLLVHLAYGVGTWISLIRIPVFLLRHRNYNIPFPIR
jgi:glycosyltransferase involved in cell wall biosynthesis